MFHSRCMAVALLSVAAILASLDAPQAQFLFSSKRLLESRESLYNNIYVYERGRYVSLTFGHNSRIYTESAINTQDATELPMNYAPFMTASAMYSKNLNSILEIGSGGGRVASYLHRYLPNASITSVELDPAVIEMAEKYFGVKEDATLHMVNRDGRLFLAGTQQTYDIILLDAYRGPFVPFHLLTKEFYQTVKQHMAEGGVVVQNVDSTTILFDSAVKTLQSVFSQVEFYRAGSNTITIAYDGPPRSVEDIRKLAEQRQAAFKFR